MVLSGLGVFYFLLPVLCIGSLGSMIMWTVILRNIYRRLFTIHGAVLLWWHTVHYPKVHWRTVKVIRKGRKLFLFQRLESQVMEGEMFSGGCSCAHTTGDGLGGPGWSLGFFLCVIQRLLIRMSYPTCYAVAWTSSLPAYCCQTVMYLISQYVPRDTSGFLLNPAHAVHPAMVTFSLSATPHPQNFENLL